MVTLPISLKPSVREAAVRTSVSADSVSADASSRHGAMPDLCSTRSLLAERGQLGQLIVLAGPSGVGKGTLLAHLLQRHPDVKVSVSATTRQPRAGEVHGQHYYFVSREQFHAMIEGGELLEWAEFAGNCYGTPKQPIETAIAQGQQVILEIELLGARQVRKTFPNAKQIFVMPPSQAALEARIRGRGQDSEEAIAKRLNQSTVELAAADEFDVKIVNDDLERAIAELERVVFGDTVSDN